AGHKSAGAQAPRLRTQQTPASYRAARAAALLCIPEFTQKILDIYQPFCDNQNHLERGALLHGSRVVISGLRTNPVLEKER
ncbi:MAG: hypothetical protein ACYSOF_04170, partial [Planctomycetota bacterium]